MIIIFEKFDLIKLCLMKTAMQQFRGPGINISLIMNYS